MQLLSKFIAIKGYSEEITNVSDSCVHRLILAMLPRPDLDLRAALWVTAFFEFIPV